MEKSDLDEIKSRLSIVDIVNSYVTITKSGKNYRGLCPFHHEKTPSFMVSPELGIFKCFGCSRGGDIFSFIQEAEGVDFVDAAKLLADKAGVKIAIKEKAETRDRKEIIFELNHLATEFYHFILTKHKLGERALKYLTEDRKLSQKTIEDFSIGYSPNSWRSLSDFLISKKFRIEDILASGLSISSENAKGYYDRFRGRITFPIKDTSGKTIGFSARTLGDEVPKYINTPETEVFHKGKVLFALDKARMNIKREGAVVLVEGQMDAISAHQAGFTNVVATSGTALTSDQILSLKRLASDIIFCFDSDFAGIEASTRGIEIASEQGMNLKVVAIPKPFKDLDECVRTDPNAFSSALENAISIYDFYFNTAFSRNNPSDPIGKKKIADTLLPRIASIANPVLREHFVRKLSLDLAVSEESILSMLNSPVVGKGESQEDPVKREIDLNLLRGTSLQEYVLVLLLKAPLDLASSTLYKLGQRDFSDSDLETIFVELKNYLLGRKRKFEIKYFLAKLNDALSEKVSVLYLKDAGSLADDENRLKEELLLVLSRIKNETVKRELKNLSIKIREAEALGDAKEIQRLSEEFKDISERLI